MAGYESATRHTIFLDYILIAQKLEQLGFTYYKGKVTIAEPIEEQKHVRLRRRSSDLSSSKLFDQNSFYQAFANDLRRAKKEVIIESPFITAKRMTIMFPLIKGLKKRGVKVIVNTKPTDEHEFEYRIQAERAITELQGLGVIVLLTNGHHRKLAMIDRRTIWEGSLNILSHNDSCEVMRRTCSDQLAKQMISFLRLEKFIV